VRCGERRTNGVGPSAIVVAIAQLATEAEVTAGKMLGSGQREAEIVER
jgi:hypothetical protein